MSSAIHDESNSPLDAAGARTIQKIPNTIWSKTAIFAFQRESMKVERTIEIGRFEDEEKGIHQTRHLTSEERLSLLEDLRQDVARVTRNENPQRLRRVLDIVESVGS